MELDINISVVDPPTVDSIFCSYQPHNTFSHDTSRLTDEEFSLTLPYMVEIEYNLLKISRLCWENNTLVYIQSGCTHIDCHASALTQENKKLIEENINAISLISRALEDQLKNYILIRLQKNLEKEISHTLN